MSVVSALINVTTDMSADTAEARTVATASGMAAKQAAQPPKTFFIGEEGAGQSLWQARRSKQRAARAGIEGRLQAALCRVLKLEDEVANLRAAAAAVASAECEEPRAQQPPAEPLPATELVERLAMVAPALVAGISAAMAPETGLANQRLRG